MTRPADPTVPGWYVLYVAAGIAAAALLPDRLGLNPVAVRAAVGAAVVAPVLGIVLNPRPPAVDRPRARRNLLLLVALAPLAVLVPVAVAYLFVW